MTADIGDGFKAWNSKLQTSQRKKAEGIEYCDWETIKTFWKTKVRIHVTHRQKTCEKVTVDNLKFALVKIQEKLVFGGYLEKNLKVYSVLTILAFA